MVYVWLIYPDFPYVEPAVDMASAVTAALFFRPFRARFATGSIVFKNCVHCPTCVGNVVRKVGEKYASVAQTSQGQEEKQ